MALYKSTFTYSL